MSMRLGDIVLLAVLLAAMSLLDFAPV